MEFLLRTIGLWLCTVACSTPMGLITDRGPASLLTSSLDHRPLITLMPGTQLKLARPENPLSGFYQFGKRIDSGNLSDAEPYCHHTYQGEMDFAFLMTKGSSSAGMMANFRNKNLILKVSGYLTTDTIVQSSLAGQGFRTTVAVGGAGLNSEINCYSPAHDGEYRETSIGDFAKNLPAPTEIGNTKMLGIAPMPPKGSLTLDHLSQRPANVFLLRRMELKPERDIELERVGEGASVSIGKLTESTSMACEFRHRATDWDGTIHAKPPLRLKRGESLALRRVDYAYDASELMGLTERFSLFLEKFPGLIILCTKSYPSANEKFWTNYEGFGTQDLRAITKGTLSWSFNVPK